MPRLFPEGSARAAPYKAAALLTGAHTRPVQPPQQRPVSEMTATRLACALLAAVCVASAYGPIKGGKKHRTTTPFPPELNPLPADSVNSVLGEAQPPPSPSPSPGSFWWQGNNAFAGVGGGSQPQPAQQPQQPQQPLAPQGNPFLTGLKQPCTASNHLCVPKQQCHDGLIVGQKKPLQATEGQCDAATQICCKLVISSQPGVVTGQFGQPGSVVEQSGQQFPSGNTGLVSGQNIPGGTNQQGSNYGGFSGKPNQPGFVSQSPAQPGQPGFVNGLIEQSQQPGVNFGPTVQSQPGLIHGSNGQPQQSGIIIGTAGQTPQTGLVHGISGQPQQNGLITGTSGQSQTSGLVYDVSGKPQQPGVIYNTNGNSQQPESIYGTSGQVQQPGLVFKPNAPMQPGNAGNPQFVSGSSNTNQFYQPSPGSNGIPIGGSIFDAPAVTPNPSQKPYTGPLNTTPYPGCAAALKCVKESFCTANGVMSNFQVILTREQFENKVPLTDCVDPETGIEGKCCRDPNYKDPWPAGMMMPTGHNDGSHTLPDECSPFGKCLHSYQCGEQNTLRPLKNCRVPLDGASGVCCSTSQNTFQTGQSILSTGASSNSQSLSGTAQTQVPIFSGEPGDSLSKNPFISQAGINSAPEYRPSTFPSQTQKPFPPGESGNSLANNPFISQGTLNSAPGYRQPNFPGQQPQTQYQPQSPGQTQTVLQTGNQNQVPHSEPASKLQPPVQNIPSVQSPSQPGYPTQQPINEPSQLPGFPTQPTNVPSSQTIQQVILPGAPILNPTPQQATSPTLSQPGVPAATGQQSVVVIQPPRTYPSPPQSTFVQQPTPGTKCGIHRQVSREGLSKNDCGFGEFPWHALIVDNNNQSNICSGAIVSPKAVVTTAHCVEQLEASDLLVKAGVWRLGQQASQPRGAQTASVAVRVAHPDYDRNSLFNDMAVLVLDGGFVPDQHVDFICVPEGPAAGPENMCVATGWSKGALQGSSRDDVLHQVPVQFLDDDSCQTSFRSTFLGSYFQLHRSFQCVLPISGDADLCQVGVGGPVACEPGDGRHVLRGLHSWDLGCGAARAPHALARVDAEWLRAVLGTPLDALLAEEQRRRDQANQQLDVGDAADKPGFAQGYGRK